MKDFFKIRTPLNEEHGAGEQGTPSLVAKYKNATPGQGGSAASAKQQPARKGDNLNAKDEPTGTVKEGIMDKLKAVKRGMEAKEKAADHFDKAGDPKNPNASKDLRRAVKYHNVVNKEETEVVDEADNGLAAKAAKSGISISTLRTVYKRGVAAWNSGHRPGTTPQQWGMARVNSYIGKGKGTYGGADKDLHEATDAVASLTKRLTKPMSYEAIDEIMQTISKSAGITPKELHNGFKQKHGKTPDDYAKGMGEAVAKDKESGLPKDYVAGLSTSTAKARAAHFNKADKLSDKDPAAYKPAPGDATAKTKLSKHTLKYRAMFGEGMDEEVYEACWDGYKQIGTKKKGNRMVPNCVPANEKTVTKPMKEDLKANLKSFRSMIEEASYKVEVEGLPTMYVQSDSPTAVKTNLRKLLRKADMIKSVDRIQDVEVKKAFRLKAMGKDEE